MATYCVSFRIANRTINGKSYDERRQRLIDNMTTKGLGFWDETTSFVLVESNLSTDEFATKACAGLSKRDDLVFLFDPDDSSAVYFGALDRRDVLSSFFPYLKKLE